MDNYVWEFTNQKKLNKKEFIDYFEKKVFKTIRKFGLLPKDRIFRIKKTTYINSKILKSILEQKFNVVYSSNYNVIDDNLSDVCEKTFQNILNGNFVGPLQKNDGIGIPLYYHSDKEMKLYAQLKNIEGKFKARNSEIQKLFGKFIEKNQDLEINVVKSMEELIQAL